jgi:hypothetical protein
MATVEKLTVFATGNGDSILIESHGFTVLTDINHKTSSEEDYPDLEAELWEACPSGGLDVFVLTHPDVDHVRGFAEVFHTDAPENHAPRTGIMVSEIWCSPYAVNPNYVTDEAKPLLDEIRRRYRLVDTAQGQLLGNRLRILSVGGRNESGELSSGLRWELLAPTIAEAQIPKVAPGEPENSSNASSLVIRWSVDSGGTSNLILLGGDAIAPVWDRIYRDNQHLPGRMAWNVLISPHHSSRYALGQKDQQESFHLWPNAVEGLSNRLGSGWVVSSSKPVLDDGDDPPSADAKAKYVAILAGASDRFLCTGTHSEDDKPGNVVFYFTAGGPARTRRGSRSGSAAATAVTGGGNYG